jgi:transposase-like protein
MGTAKRYSMEVRERAVRLVLEQQSEHGSQWASILSVSAKIGCAAQSLHRWVTQAERDLGKRAWPCPGFPDTTVRWDDGTGGGRWQGEHLRASSSSRRSSW